MTKALVALRRDDHTTNVQGWLFRIAHNEAISLLRRRRPTTELHDVLHDRRLGPAGDLLLREELRATLDGVRALPHNLQHPLLLRELAGLSYGQVAEVVGGTPAAARKAVFDARIALSADRAGRDEACSVIRQSLSEGDGRRRRARVVRSHLQSCQRLLRVGERAAPAPHHLAALLPAASAAGSAGGWLAGAVRRRLDGRPPASRAALPRTRRSPRRWRSSRPGRRRSWSASSTRARSRRRRSRRARLPRRPRERASAPAGRPRRAGAARLRARATAADAARRRAASARVAPTGSSRAGEQGDDRLDSADARRTRRATSPRETATRDRRATRTDAARSAPLAGEPPTAAKRRRASSTDRPLLAAPARPRRAASAGARSAHARRRPRGERASRRRRASSGTAGPPAPAPREPGGDLPHGASRSAG